MNKQTGVSVTDYIVERLAAEGISHCFGVAGDYLFPICDAVDSSAKVKWVGVCKPNTTQRMKLKSPTRIALVAAIGSNANNLRTGSWSDPASNAGASAAAPGRARCRHRLRYQCELDCVSRAR